MYVLYLVLTENDGIVSALQSFVGRINAQMFKRVYVIVLPSKSVKEKNGIVG